MHVAVDGIGNRAGGGWAVLTRTVAELAADSRVSRITVFSSPLDLVPAPPPNLPGVQWVERGREQRSPPARLAWFSVGLDSEVDRLKADVVLTMNGVGRTVRPRVCVIQQAFAVSGRLTQVRPRSFAAKLAVLRRETRGAASSASAVVVQTSWMASQVARTLGLKAHVLPLGLPRRIEEPVERSANSVLVVGADLPYKRREIALEAVSMTRGKHPDLELTVVDDVSPARVDELLRSATLLVAPSDVESFGLPVVEAFAAGCPVIASDTPWAHAVADNAALYFDAGSAASAARRIGEVLRDPALAEDLRGRGRLRFDRLWAERPYTGLVDLFEEVA